MNSIMNYYCATIIHKMRATFKIMLAAGFLMATGCFCHAQGTGQPSKEWMKSSEDVFYYNCKVKNGTIKPGSAGDRTVYHYDQAGNTIESEYRLGSLLHHGRYEYDSHGQMTYNELLDETGDTIICCRYQHSYDAWGLRYEQVCRCQGTLSVTEYSNTDYGDSTAQDIFEEGSLKYREVFDTQGRKIKSYSHPNGNGKFTLLQISAYEPAPLPPTNGLDAYSDVSFYEYNEHGDITKSWELAKGKWTEETRYEYEYDSHGNWTTKLIITRNSITLVKRSIQY